MKSHAFDSSPCLPSQSQAKKTKDNTRAHFPEKEKSILLGLNASIFSGMRSRGKAIDSTTMPINLSTSISFYLSTSILLFLCSISGGIANMLIRALFIQQCDTQSVLLRPISYTRVTASLPRYHQGKRVETTPVQKGFGYHHLSIYHNNDDQSDSSNQARPATTIGSNQASQTSRWAPTRRARPAAGLQSSQTSRRNPCNS